MKRGPGHLALGALLCAVTFALGAPRAASAGDGTIQMLGEGDRTLYVVDLGGKWSMHAENLSAQDLFQLWRTVGGPRVLSKKPIDYPFTLSVHGMTAERIVARVFEGYGYTLHYRDGKLDEVHVYSVREPYSYKTPRLTETRTRWSEEEKAALPESAPPEATAAEPPVPAASSALPPIGSAETGGEAVAPPSYPSSVARKIGSGEEPPQEDEEP